MMKGRLLIIDDEPDYCSLLKRQLGVEYDVTTFSDPGAAVGYLLENPVDVVVTDIRMPEVSGIDILRSAKSRSLNTDVVLMSAFATVNNAVEAMKEGAYDYIVKPFDPAELSLRLKRLFEKRALLEANKTSATH
jgi:DNA-binding NtrC family response regulator